MSFAAPGLLFLGKKPGVELVTVKPQTLTEKRFRKKSPDYPRILKINCF